MTFTPRRTALSAALALAAGLTLPASGALVQFTAAGGGAWNEASNWDTANVPTANDTVYFGYQMPGDDATVTLSDDAEAKNLTGDANGPDALTLDLGGNTLELSNQSDIKFPLTITNGEVVVPNQFVVQDGGTLTLGEDADLKATGGTNAVQVDDGGTLVLDGGSLAGHTALRDVAVNSGGTLKLMGAGDLTARDLNLADDATLAVTLTEDGYEDAPLTVEGNVTGLGELEVNLADGFTPEPGQTFYVIVYFKGVSDTFTNAAEGETVKAGNTAFTVKYHDDGQVSLTAAGGSSGGGSADDEPM